MSQQTELTSKEHIQAQFDAVINTLVTILIRWTHITTTISYILHLHTFKITSNKSYITSTQQFSETFVPTIMNKSSLIQK